MPSATTRRQRHSRTPTRGRTRSACSGCSQGWHNCRTSPWWRKRHFLAGAESAAVTAAFLLAIEALYLTVRRLNRQTAFREASYGFKDRGPLSGGPTPIDASRERREAEVERKLAELRKMAEDGRISQRAYEKACDRHRVRVVMAKDVS